MYIVTGGAGFIGSAFIAKLNEEGIRDILIVDELGTTDKWKNIRNKDYLDYLHKDTFLNKIAGGKKYPGLKGIIHLGACSSTTEMNMDYLMENNYRYTGALAEYALSMRARFIYASSAATYGDGERGYSDDEGALSTLSPMNPYGYSKHLFDLFVARNNLTSKFVGLKYFNVYGPNEAHKGDMRSMVLKSYEQIKASGRVKLFHSYRPEFKDGEQKRDFIYVKDCTDIMFWLLNDKKTSGIFNLGSGSARSWNDLATAVFSALGKPPSIEYIEMPQSIRGQYQYFTEAKMDKLFSTACPVKPRSLEDGVKDYVVNYLEKGTVL